MAKRKNMRRLLKQTTKNKIIFQGVDSPLKDPKDDCLDRAFLADRIFDVIENAPAESNIRVGLFGAWGSGKTTTMNFIKAHCVTSQQPFAEVNPWHFKTREEAWEGFALAIDRGIAKWQGKQVGEFERQKVLKKGSEFVQRIADVAQSSIGKAIASLILTPLQGMLDVTKEKVQELLNKTLKEKRLYIFIDDLDRADFDVAYDFLSFLNEFCDFNKCIYVISLDRKMASQIIKTKTGIDELRSKEFIEKIINWSFDLPVPSRQDWCNLLLKELRNLDKTVDAKILEELLEYMPKTPRKFKHYLRFLSSLHKCFISRFDKNELNLKALYLAQLLRFEFPDEFEKLNQDNFIKGNLQNVYFDEYKLNEERQRKGKDSTVLAEWEKRIDNIFSDYNRKDQAERFKTIYNALRQEGRLLVGSIDNHLFVVENPEPLTWKEYNIIKGQLRKSRKKEPLGAFFSKEINAGNIAKVREFIRMLLRERDAILQRISDTGIREEQKTLMNNVDSLMFYCEQCLTRDDLFLSDPPIFDVATFEEWFNHLKRWMHFAIDKELYGTLRNNEKELIKKMFDKLGGYDHYLLKVYATICNAAASAIIGSEAAFQDTAKEILAELNLKICLAVVSSFEKENGIDHYFANDNYYVRDNLLLNGASIFYGSENLDRIAPLAAKAREDFTIQKNFIDFIHQLFSEVRHQQSLDKNSKLGKIFHNEKFVDLFWKSAIATPLNSRFIGTLKDQRKRIVDESFDKDNNALPVPPWFEQISEEIDKKTTR